MPGAGGRSADPRSRRHAAECCRASPAPSRRPPTSFAVVGLPPRRRPPGPAVDTVPVGIMTAQPTRRRPLWPEQPRRVAERARFVASFEIPCCRFSGRLCRLCGLALIPALACATPAPIRQGVAGGYQHRFRITHGCGLAHHRVPSACPMVSCRQAMPRAGLRSGHAARSSVDGGPDQALSHDEVTWRGGRLTTPSSTIRADLRLPDLPRKAAGRSTSRPQTCEERERGPALAGGLNWRLPEPPLPGLKPWRACTSTSSLRC
jgi:hypothetical protein